MTSVIPLSYVECPRCKTSGSVVGYREERGDNVARTIECLRCNYEGSMELKEKLTELQKLKKDVIDFQLK